MLKLLKSILTVFAVVVVTAGSYATTFTVNNAGDTDNGLSYNNPADSNTLRKVIRLANATTGPHTINFNLASPYKITLTTTLPTIGQQTTIDGSSQPGFAGTPLVVIDGAGTPTFNNGIDLSAGGSVIKSLRIINFPYCAISLSTSNNYQVINNIIHSCKYGILAYMSGSATIKGNIFGTNENFNTGLNNSDIDLNLNQADNFVIGGSGVGEGNIFAGSGSSINISQNCDNTIIKGNKIGTNGTVALTTTGQFGVYVNQGATGTIIGGAGTNEGNIIGGFTNSGIFSLAPVIIKGNKIGINSSGTHQIPNNAGIGISATTDGVVIGGTGNGEGNLISGNTYGIYLSNAGGTSILGNKIGTDITGNNAVANEKGISGYVGSNTIIGGSAPGARNIISGNSNTGIEIYSSTIAPIIKGNIIGLNASGNSAVPNSMYGIYIYYNSKAEIGGALSGEGNIISGNGYFGIRIEQGSEILIKGNKIGTDITGMNAIPNSTGLSVTQTSNIIVGGSSSTEANIISGNSGTGIELYYISGIAEVKGNIIGLNANGNAALGNGSMGMVVGETNSNLLIGGNGYGEGNIISSNIHGLYAYNSTSLSVKGNKIGTDITGNVDLGNQFVGILFSSVRFFTIGGDTPEDGNLVSGNGSEGINLSSVEGCIIKNNIIGTNLSGTSAIPNADGLILGVYENNYNCYVEKNLISGNTGSGIKSWLQEVHIIGNKIGTNAAGTAALPNGEYGIYTTNYASNTTIGGWSAADGNIISGNGLNGIRINSYGANILSNKIGLGVNDTPIGNGSTGIFMDAESSYSYIGGDGSIANVIANNGADGISIVTGSSIPIRANTIFNNTGKAINLNLGGGTPGNLSKPAPTITSVIYSAPNYIISGTSQGSDAVEVFTSDAFGKNAYVYLGAASANATTGAWTLSIANPPGNYFVATATSTGMNTSELSNVMAYNCSAEPTVLIKSVAPANFFNFGSLTLQDKFQWQVVGVPALNPPTTYTNYTILLQVAPQKKDATTGALVPDWANKVEYTVVYPSGTLNVGMQEKLIDDLLDQQETDKNYFWRVGLKYLVLDAYGNQPVSWSDVWAFTLKGSDKVIPAAAYLAAGNPNAATHTNKINWMYEVTFLDDNKTNQGITYMDGLGLGRQSQVLMNTSNKVICSETAYSEEGGGSVQSMAAPINVSQFSYAYRFFDVNVSGTYSDFSTEHFDREVKGSTYNDIMPSFAVDNTAGVGYYYSANNTMESYVDNAEGFPYAYSVGYKEPSGRTMLSGGVGSTFKITGGKEIKSATSGVSFEELARVYGKTAAAGMSNITKSVVTDANGVSSVSYSDMEGKVIATALQGCSAPNLDALTEDGMNGFTSTYDVLKNDKLNKESLTKVSNANFYVPCGNTSVALHYEIDLGIYTIGTGNCDNCLYDLQVKVVEDATKAEIYNDVRQLPTTPPAPNCSTSASNYSYNQNITIPRGGTYTVYRTITPHMDVVTGKTSVQQAIDTYVSTLVTSNPTERAAYEDELYTRDEWYVVRKQKTSSTREPQPRLCLDRFAGVYNNSAVATGYRLTATLGNNVSAMDVDANGNIYFVNHDRYISKIDKVTGNVSTLLDFQSLGYAVYDLTVDESGNVYFTDFTQAGKIRKLSTTGIVTDVYTAKTYKRAIKYHKGNIYFTHASASAPSTNSNISKISTTGTLLKDGYLASGSELPYYMLDNVSKSLAVRISTSGSEEIFHTSTGGHVVYKVISGSYQVLAGATGTSGYVNGAPLSSRFRYPKGIAFDQLGNLYVRDQYTIRKLEAGTYNVTKLAGTDGTNGFTDGTIDLVSTTLNGAQYIPGPIVFDLGGNLYIGDLNSIRIISQCGTLPTCPEVLPTTQITYNQGIPQKLVLQPGSEGKDAYVFSRTDMLNTPNGGAATTAGCAWTWSGDAGVYRTLIDFDRSKIPSGAYIVDAKLSLYSKSGLGSAATGHSSLSGSNACWLERITQNWQENLVTWNNQPTTTTTNRVALAQSTSQFQSYENIDVTVLLRDMMLNPTTSFGFMLKLQTEAYYRQLLFGSSDHPDPTIRPKLEIIYVTDPPSGGCANLATITNYATVNMSVVPGPTVSGTPVTIGSAVWQKGMTPEAFASAMANSINTNSVGTNVGFKAVNTEGGSYFDKALNTVKVIAPLGTGSTYNGWQLRHSIVYDANMNSKCFRIDTSSSYIGNNLLTNGDFSQSTGGWYTDNARTILAAFTGAIYTSGSGNSSIYSNKIMTIGKRYRLKFESLGASGAGGMNVKQVKASDYSSVTIYSVSGNKPGKYEMDFVATGEILNINLGLATVDNFSLTELRPSEFSGGFNAGACTEYLPYLDQVSINNITVGGSPKVEIADLDGKVSGVIGDEKYVVNSIATQSGITTARKMEFLNAYERMHWVKIKEENIKSMETYSINNLISMPAILDDKSLDLGDYKDFYLLKIKYKGPSCEDNCKPKDFTVNCEDNCSQQLKSLDAQLQDAYAALATTPITYSISGFPANKTLQELVALTYPFTNAMIEAIDVTDALTVNANYTKGFDLYVAYESARTARERFNMDDCRRTCNGDLTSADKCASVQETYRSCVYENIQSLTAGNDFLMEKWPDGNPFPYSTEDDLEKDRNQLGDLLFNLLLSEVKTPGTNTALRTKTNWDISVSQASHSCSNCGAPANTTYGCSAGQPWDVGNFPDILLNTLTSANVACSLAYLDNLDMTFNPALGVCKQNNANCKKALAGMTVGSPEYNAALADCDTRFNCAGSNLTGADDPQRYSLIRESLGRLYGDQAIIDTKTPQLYNETKNLSLGDLTKFLFDYESEEWCRIQCSNAFEAGLQQWLEEKKLTAVETITNQFLTACYNRNEKLTVSYTTSIYHYTLFNYNYANELVSTVPPEGIDFVNIADADPLKANRVPSHRMISTYITNSKGELTNAYSPDANNTKYLYDKAGRIRYSQTDEQLARGTLQSKVIFSYIKYDDESGRITETGEYIYTSDALGKGFINPSPGGADIYASDKVDNYTWPTDGNRTYEEHYFYYDNAQLVLTGYIQENLHNRISKISNAHSNEYYSYDKHGRMKWSVQEILDMEVVAQRFKVTEYDYKPLTSQVTKVTYQKGNAGEEMGHRFTYDQDNRVTQVELSRDGVTWNKAANYEYYLHGTLKARGLGDDIQRLNYVWNLQGWLKAVNNPIQSYDPGQDGISGSYAKDVFAEVLNYYSGDYKLTGKGLDAANAMTPQSGTHVKDKGKDLFNGNISSIVTYTGFDQIGGSTIDPLMAQGYRYDVLNRLVGNVTNTKAVTGFSGWTANTTAIDNIFQENLTYDANGNIKTLQRTAHKRVVNSTGGQVTALDNMTYRYDQSITDFYGAVKKANNKLNYIDDSDVDDNLIDDIKDQASGNYTYDAKGRMTQDLMNEIQTITYYPNDKVKEIIRTSGSSKPRLLFTYDATGERISKTVIKSVTDQTQNYTVYYAGGGQAIYEKRFINQTQYKYILLEQAAFGGVYKNGNEVYNGGTITTTLDKTKLLFEINDHLGNVRAVVTGQKTGVNATIVNLADYYAFGMEITTRQYSAQSYRYGFNGMEKDNEWNGDPNADGNTYGTEFRQYDSRIGRWMSPDPLASMFADQSPYDFVFNCPLVLIDPLGLAPMGDPPTGGKKDLKHNKIPTGEGNKFIEHVVKQGENLWLLSKKYEVSIGQIMEANQEIKKAGLIYKGQKIKIPNKNYTPTPTKKPVVKTIPVAQSTGIEEEDDGPWIREGEAPWVIKFVNDFNPMMSVVHLYGWFTSDGKTNAYGDVMDEKDAALEGMSLIPGGKTFKYLGMAADGTKYVSKLAKNWPFKKITCVDDLLKASCDDDALQIQKIIGGEIFTVSNPLGRALGPVKTSVGEVGGWFYHKAVRHGDMIFDRITGPQGLPIDEYKKLFEYADDLIFK